MSDGQSGKKGPQPSIAIPNQVQPYGGQGPQPGYSGPQYSGQPGPVTGQPGPGQPFGYHSSNTTVVVTQQQVPTRPRKQAGAQAYVVVSKILDPVAPCSFVHNSTCVTCPVSLVSPVVCRVQSREPVP